MKKKTFLGDGHRDIWEFPEAVLPGYEEVLNSRSICLSGASPARLRRETRRFAFFRRNIRRRRSMRYLMVLGCIAVLMSGCMVGDSGGGSCCSGVGSGPQPRTGAPPAAAEGGVLYKCSHDGATRTSPGPCPTCGMTLDERYRVAQ